MIPKRAKKETLPLLDNIRTVLQKYYIGRWFIILFCFNSFISKAQDVHFSQFYFTPVAINPGNTGNFDGGIRFVSSYKNQWKNIANPYKSIFSSLDFYTPKQKIGLGLSFFNDKAGTSNLVRTLADISVSYRLKMTREHHLITGVQYGFGLRRIESSQLKWDNQYDGYNYDPSLTSGEAVTEHSESYNYMDLSAGTVWKYFEKQSGFESNTGVAVFHLNQPTTSFYVDDRLKMKLVVHHSTSIPIDKAPVFIEPQFLFLSQGPHYEVNIGTLVRFVHQLKNTSFSNFNQAVGGRKVRGQSSNKSSIELFAGAQFRYRDAFIAVLGFEFNKALLVSYSYDVNVSKLKGASNSRGGSEIVIGYTLGF